MDFAELGYLRLAAASPQVELGDVAANARIHERISKDLAGQGASLVLFPELSLTGYSCEDLFMQRSLQEAVEAELASLANAIR